MDENERSDFDEPVREDARAEVTGCRFGAFELDMVARMLTREGEEIRLAPRILALLEYLVRHPGAACSREQLMDAVWAGVIVSDQSLTEAVWRLRQALGDDSRDPTYIATIPGHGFRFVAEVEAVRPSGEPPSAVAAEAARMPLWKLALPGAALSGLLLAAILAGAFLEAGPASPPRPALREMMAEDERPVVDWAAQLSVDATRLVFADYDPARLRWMDVPSGEVADLGSLDRIWNGRSYAWSPDGEYVALGDRPERGGAGRIDVFRVADAERRTLAEATGELYFLAGWGPQGRHLLTVVHRPNGPRGLRLVEAAGGNTVREWALDGDAKARVSPDGRWIAFSRLTESGGELVIVPIADIWTQPESIPDDHFGDLSRWGRVTDPPCADDAPHWGPASDRLIFFTFRAGGRELWTVRLDDGAPIGQPEPHRVPGSPYTVAGWAPNGEVVFCSLSTVHDVAIATLDEGATRLAAPVTRLTLWEGRARSPAWSAASDRLLFTGQGDGTHAVRIATLGVGEDERIGADTEIESVELGRRYRVPVWSPDRETIYYVSWLEGGGQGLFAFDRATATNRALLDGEPLFAPTPRLARAGRLLLFNNADASTYPALRDIVTRPAGLYLLDLETGQTRRIVEGVQRAAAISEDGRWVAFVDDDHRQLTLLDVENGTRTELASAPGEWGIEDGPTFSPDGRRIAYIRARADTGGFCSMQQLWIVERDGSENRRIEELDRLGVNDIAWSPDGLRIAMGLYDCRSSLFTFEP